METTFQFGPIQTAWLEALESGKYAQGEGALNKNGQFCCLGVLLEVMGIASKPLEAAAEISGYLDAEGGTFVNYPSLGMSQKAGLHGIAGNFVGASMQKDGRSVNTLAQANDLAKATFPEIAAFIRANPQAVFDRAA